MKDPVKITFEGPGYVVIARIIAILIIGGFSVEPLLRYLQALL
ncbi:hypothetical protein [Kordiimonas marina]|nr:hypothetical protein [Kordiimonas marina]